MASTRSTPRVRRAAPSSPAGTPTAALLALVRHGARVHIAACTTAATTLRAWAETTDAFTQAVADELVRRVDGESGSSELLAGVTAAGGTHLRELSALPRAAADHFDARMTHASTDHKEAR